MREVIVTIGQASETIGLSCETDDAALAWAIGLYDLFQPCHEILTEQSEGVALTG